MSLFGIDAEAINPEVYDPHPPTAEFYQRITCHKNSVRFMKAGLLFSSTQKANDPNAKEDHFDHLRPVFAVVVVPPLKDFQILDRAKLWNYGFQH